MDLQLLQFILDGGSSAFLIYLVIRLLTRIDVITDRILTNQEQASAERAVIASEVGLNPVQLEHKARAIMQKRPSNSKGSLH